MSTTAGLTRIPPQNIRQFLDLTERATDGGTPCHRRPDMFFSFNDDETEAAKRMCLTGGPDGGRCPVIALCLRFAMDARQDEGVYGGMEPDERRSLRRREAKAREAKAKRDAEEAAGQDTLPIPIIETPEVQRAVRRHLVPRPMASNS